MNKEWTLNEYQEHLKQSREYDLEDEVIQERCHECDHAGYQCDMFRWKFKHNSGPRWYCKECFKLNKDNENE